MPRVYIETYGCTLNHADSDIMRALLKDKHEIVDNEEDSEVVILNTCTVKGATENKIIEKMRSLNRQNKKFVVAGCMTANEKKIKKIAPNSSLVGTSSLKWITSAVEESLVGNGTTHKIYESKDGLPKILTTPISRIPINDGCTSSCHFCQTKLARPYLRSYSPKTIVNWINESVKLGAREIQLTSMDSGAYGLDIKTDLVSLLEALSKDDSYNRAQNEFLVRLGMINPNHAMRLLPGIIRSLENKRFYKFLHVPVQSGSEKVCKEMNRDHTVKEFLDIVNAVRAKIPEASIATDIIVGYPTETEDDFLETVKLIENTKPEVINISRFSPRPGTKAKELKQLPVEEVKRRSGQVAILLRKIGEERRKILTGKKYRVLITEKQEDFKGRNINYHQVIVNDFKGRVGDFVMVEITGATHGSLFADVVE